MSDPRDELLARAVDSIMHEVSDAFDTIWARPDAMVIATAFIGERLVFQIDHRGITIAMRPDDPPDTPPADPPASTGQYL
jgi:hypothetical protein